MENKYTTRIREIIPHLDLSVVEAIDPTSADDVVLVNNELVFRFLKGDRTEAQFANQVGIIDLIRDRVHLDLPNPFYAQEGVIAYKELAGNAFSESVIENLREPDQRSVADQFAGLLKTIHQAPLYIFEENGLRPAPAPTRANWLIFRANFKEKIAPYFSDSQIVRGLGLFALVLDDEHALDYQPCLVHGKLHSHHLLFDAKSRRIKSIDGFCRAGLGDAALDIALVLLHWNEKLVSNFATRYPDVATLMKRARIHVQAFELRRAFVAAETGDLSGFKV